MFAGRRCLKWCLLAAAVAGLAVAVVYWVDLHPLEGASLAREILARLPSQVIPETTGEIGTLPDGSLSSPTIACQLWVNAGRPPVIRVGAWEYFMVFGEGDVENQVANDHGDYHVVLEFWAIEPIELENRLQWTRLIARRRHLKERIGNLLSD